MSPLDELLPLPRKLEIDSVELAAAPAVVWEHVRNRDLADSGLVRALFALRTLPSRLIGAEQEPRAFLRLDDLRSTPEEPGFQLLAESPQRSVTVGAIGKVWQLDIPFVHLADAHAYAAFGEPGWVKVAWEIRIEALGAGASRLSFEVRVDATDDASWKKFTRYWRLIGPGSHLVRHAILADLKRRFGSPESHEEERALAGDELLADAAAQATHSLTIEAKPEAIWPWLVQMGCHRAGFYSIDMLDNGGVASARELHPEWQHVHVGQVLAASPKSDEGFEVLSLEPNRTLVLGGLFDMVARRQLAFSAPRPTAFWHVTWAFILEPVGETATRLCVRARAAYSLSERFHVAWIVPVHALMQRSQLAHLALRAEGRLARDTLADVGRGISGAAIMALALLSPFLRGGRNHWGLSAARANEPQPGDNLVAAPDWSWTHAVEIDASCEQVWPWVAQIGADRAGFYSYQWLENLAGCNVINAEAIHTEWQHQPGDTLLLHPEIPAIPVVTVQPGRVLIAFAPPDAAARAEGRPWVTLSWAFVLEPLECGRCRLISRFRTACSSDLATRLTQGPWLLEPIGFAMDRRMLLGIRDRAQAARQNHRHA